MTRGDFSLALSVVQLATLKQRAERRPERQDECRPAASPPPGAFVE